MQNSVEISQSYASVLGGSESFEYGEDTADHAAKDR